MWVQNRKYSEVGKAGQPEMGGCSIITIPAKGTHHKSDCGLWTMAQDIRRGTHKLIFFGLSATVQREAFVPVQRGIFVSP